MNLKVVPILSVAAVLMVLWCVVESNTPLNNGARLIEAGNYQEAKDLYSAELHGKHSADARYLYERSYANQMLKQYELALVDLNDAEKIVLSPNYSWTYSGSCSSCRQPIDQIYLSRGTVYRLQGKNQESVDEVSKILKKNKNDCSALFQRALSYQALSQFDNARNDLNAGLKTQGFSPEERYLHTLGDVEKAAGRFNEALSSYNNALKLRNCKQAYVDRAMTYLALKQVDNCKKDLESALSVDPRFEPALHERARLAMSEGNYAQAERDLDAAQASDPTCKLIKDDRAKLQKLKSK